MKRQLLACIALGVPIAAASAQTTEFLNYADFQNAVATAGSPLTIVDFDDAPHGSGTLDGSEYASLGMTIVHRDGHPINVVKDEDRPYATDANFNSAPHGISASFDIDTIYHDGRSDNFDFVLAQPANFAGVWIGNLGSGGSDATEVQFLDAAGNILASEVVIQFQPEVVFGGGSEFNNRIFYGLATDAAVIATIRTIDPAFDGDGITYDDVQFSVPCPGDADGDGSVTLSDLALVLADFGMAGAGLGGDVDGDGDVDLNDLAAVLAAFGQSCN